MIIDVEKVLIYGPREEMDPFYAYAQRAGFIEFIGPSHKRALEMPEQAQIILSALRVLKHLPVPTSDAAVRDPVAHAKRIVDTQGEIERVQEEMRLLKADIARVAPLGHFSMEEVRHLERETHRVVQFFCMKSELSRGRQHAPELLYVGTDYDLDYFVAVNRERTQYPQMIELHVEHPVSELREREGGLRKALFALEEDLKTLSLGLKGLQNGLNDALNAHHLQVAKHDAQFHLSEQLFVVEAWVPANRIRALEGLLSTFAVGFEVIARESRDVTPTYMENRGFARIGEDLVHIYDTPSSTDKDPSGWVLASFSVFFAMIVSDAGYGLIYLALALLLKWKWKDATGAFKRFQNLAMILATACIGWGVLTASFFGVQISPESPVRNASMLYTLAKAKASYHLAQQDDVYDIYARQFPAVSRATDGESFLLSAVKGQEYVALDEFTDNILMELAILVGILHISLSLLRYASRNWSSIGWFLFLIGGYLYIPSIINATTMANFAFGLQKPLAYAIGQPVMYTGYGLAVGLALVRHKWSGLLEITNVVQIFADVLSYLRLYALGLAGIVMANTFNYEIGAKAGLIGGFFVILAGHAINIVLATMGAMIHGLRLNFLEWYHYSFEGGGKLFNPLRIKRIR